MPQGIVSYKNTDLVSRFCNSVRTDATSDMRVYSDGRACFLMKNKYFELYKKEKVFLTLDGRISNLECLNPGEKTFALTDEEAILHAYKIFGLKLFEKLEGNFALFIYDLGKNRMFLGVDHVGIKPLFYARTEGGLIFGSDITSILRSKIIKASTDGRKLREYLTLRYVSGHETIYANIRQLPGGHFLTLDNVDNFKLEEYWNPHVIMTENIMQEKDEDQYASEINRMAAENIKSRIDIFGETGIMLSGGLDSTYLLNEVAKYASNIKTFTLGFLESKNPDIDNTKTTVSRYSVDPKYILVSNKEYADNLLVALKNFNFPLDHPNFVARDILFKKAKNRNICNLIAGEGSDTIFGGSWYISLKKYLLIKKLIPNYFNILIPKSKTRGKLWTLRKALSTPIDELILFDKTYLDPEDIILILNPAHLQNSDNFDYVRHELKRASNLGYLDQAFYMGLKTTLSIYPRDQIIMANSNGVNVEYPFLDKNILEYSLRIPGKIKLKNFTAKYIFKKAAQQNLSNEIFSRKKSGLPVPMASWLRDPVGMGRYLEMLQDKTTKKRGLYDMVQLKTCISSFIKGNDRMAEVMWVLINLELWHRIFIDNNFSAKSEVSI